MSYGGDYGRRGSGDPRRPQGRPPQRTQMMPMPMPGQQRGYGGPQSELYGDPERDSYGDRNYGEPPRRSGPPPRQLPPDRAPMGEQPRRRRRWGIGRILLTLLLVVVLFIAGVWVYLEFSISRTDALHDYAGRPAAAEGTNWLIVGSDSRDGLSKDEETRLSTGDSKAAGGGKRTDTIMIAHIPDNDTPATLLSLPRDSQVRIPGRGTGQINSAFAVGDAPLLVETVEGATGLRMDHYAEIGFGGFANIVDAIGGVDICLDKPVKDAEYTKINLPAGCQTLDGASGLGFVRTRHADSTPRSDLDRVVNQRKFIGALANQIASPGTLLNPFDLFPLLSAGPDALTMDSGDHVHNLLGLAWAMRGISSGGVVTTTVPVTSGSAQNWDKAKSKQLFDAMKKDTPIPDSVIVQ